MDNNKKKFDISRYSEIKDVTSVVKLPMAEEKIRLGEIRISTRTGEEYPVELDYFVCPKEVREVFGDEPTEITVFFPIADRKKVFQQSYERYGKNKALLCWGDGITAQQKNLEDGSWEDRKCPCEYLGKSCDKRGHLRFMLPSVSIGKFYECQVGGTVSFQELNSAFFLAERTTGGCWAMVPFKMRRVQKRLKIPGTAKMKTHWVVTLELIATLEEVRRVAAGEILYLGQRRKYELEIPDLSEQKDESRKVYTQEKLEKEEQEEAEARGITVEELRESKEIEEAATERTEREDSKKDFEESKEREAKLQEEVARGKHKVKSYQESKSIFQKKKGEEAQVIEELLKKASEAGLKNWGQIINFTIKEGILQTSLSEISFKKVLATNKDIYNCLMKALEPTESARGREKLDKIFETFKKAGIPTWREIAYFACAADLKEPGSPVEELQKTLLDNPEAVEKIIEVAKIREEQEIADEDIPD